MYLTDKIPWLLEPTLLTMLIRTLLSILCGFLIGYGRNIRGGAAGIRTHILVCLGAMLAMSTGQFTALMYEGVDASRIGASVVSGIGFLGAGSILVTQHKYIRGLTTAAGLWASGCIGLAIGIGFYEGALVGTVAVFFTEQILSSMTKPIKEKGLANLQQEELEEHTSVEDEDI